MHMIHKYILILTLLLIPFVSMALTKIDVNNASQRELTAYLKGVGKKKAQSIIDYRRKHGKFKTIQDLIKVKGISKKIVEKNKDRISFRPD